MLHDVWPSRCGLVGSETSLVASSFEFIVGCLTFSPGDLRFAMFRFIYVGWEYDGNGT